MAAVCNEQEHVDVSYNDVGVAPQVAEEAATHGRELTRLHLPLEAQTDRMIRSPNHRATEAKVPIDRSICRSCSQRTFNDGKARMGCRAVSTIHIVLLSCLVGLVLVRTFLKAHTSSAFA